MHLNITSINNLSSLPLYCHNDLQSSFMDKLALARTKEARLLVHGQTLPVSLQITTSMFPVLALSIQKPKRTPQRLKPRAWQLQILDSEETSFLYP